MTTFTDQPIHLHRGHAHFQKNLIVDRLLDEGGMPIDELVAVLPSWKPREDEIAQFFDLVGYTRDGAPSGKPPSNELVVLLIKRRRFDMNALVIHMIESKPPRDHIDQFYQLIGYSVDGYLMLNQVSDAAKDRAFDTANALLATKH